MLEYLAAVAPPGMNAFDRIAESRIADTRQRGVPAQMRLLGDSLRLADRIGTSDDAHEKQRLQERRSRLLVQYGILMEHRAEQGR